MNEKILEIEIEPKGIKNRLVKFYKFFRVAVSILFEKKTTISIHDNGEGDTINNKIYRYEKSKK